MRLIISFSALMLPQFPPPSSIHYFSPLNPCPHQSDFTQSDASSHSSHCRHILHKTLYILLTSILSWPLVTRRYLCKFLCYSHTVPFQRRTPPLFSHFCSLLELEKNQLYRLSPHPFRSPSAHNLHPFPTLSIVLSMSFQNFSLSSPIPSLGPYPTTTQSLPLENLTLMRRILDLTRPKSIRHSIGWPHLPYLFPSPEHWQ